MLSKYIAKTKTPKVEDFNIKEGQLSVQKDHIPSSFSPSSSGYPFSTLSILQFAMLLFASVFASILFSSQLLGLVSAQSVDSYIATQGPISKANLLANIGSSGAKSSGAKAGIGMVLLKLL